MDWLLERGPSAVSLFTAAAVATSALYNIAYFLLIDPQLLFVMTLSDYISYTVLATALVAILGGYIWTVFASSAPVRKILQPPHSQSDEEWKVASLISWPLSLFTA